MHQRIISAIRRIPSGKVSTYGAVARAAGFPGAARQVVWALHSARGPVIPWHRVLGSGGEIKLPGEAGFEQRMRLQSERVEFRGKRVNMAAHEFKFSKRRAAKKPLGEQLR